MARVLESKTETFVIIIMFMREKANIVYETSCYVIHATLCFETIKY